MGNICRSPMAERLLAARLRDELGPVADELVHSHGAGTGFWHEGDRMNAPAARQVLARGGDPDSFRARGLDPAFLLASDLVLTATAEQVEFVLALEPGVARSTFVLGEFGRLLAEVDAAALPPFEPTVPAAASRGRALVAAVDAVRAGAWPHADDDLDDPYGRSDEFFSKTADQVEAAIAPLVRLLTDG
jgi:protein-tyrosine phosphatase